MHVEDFIVSEQATLLQAMKQLDETGQRILFVAPQGKLVAVLTDGDIRKHILSGGDYNNTVQQAANYRPFSLPVAERTKARAELEHRCYDAVPLLDKQGCINDIMFANEYNVNTRKKVCQPVVIMAGGLGTRLYPYTKILPKPLIPIGELPIIEHIINRFADFGCHSFNLVVNYKKGMIKSYFADLEKDYQVDFTDEDEPLGTGGGLSLLKGKMDESFFLTNCDTLIDADYGDLHKVHKQQGNVVTMVCAMKTVQIPYGVIELGAHGEISDITEKPEMNFLTNTGMYVVEPRVVEEMASGQYVGFPDIIEKYRLAGEKVGVYPISEQSWMDMGQLEELEEMRRRMEGKG